MNTQTPMAVLAQQLIGRADYLATKGSVKTVTLLRQAAAALSAQPTAWDVRNAEISYRGIFATEKEARAVADQHDEAGYSQAVVTPLHP